MATNNITEIDKSSLFKDVIEQSGFAMKILTPALKWTMPHLKQYLFGSNQSTWQMSQNIEKICLTQSNKKLLELIGILNVKLADKKIAINKLILLEIVSSGALVLVQFSNLIEAWNELSKASNLLKQSGNKVNQINVGLAQLRELIPELELNVLMFVLAIGCDVQLENGDDKYRELIKNASKNLQQIKSETEFEKRSLQLQRKIMQCSRIYNKTYKDLSKFFFVFLQNKIKTFK